MKRFVLLLVVLIMITVFFGCAYDGSVSEIQMSSVTEGELAAGYLPADIETALTANGYNLSTETCVVVGRITNDVVKVRQFGDVRRMEIDTVIKGDVTEVNLAQPYYETPRLEVGKTYLILIKWNNLLIDDPARFVENEYDVVGVANQCVFWIENGQLCGMDENLVAEIQSSTAAYGAKGAAPDVNTMNGLVDYFAARVAALE